MTVMKGPADPDQFRQQVGRYGERWYVDNLPPCDLHQPTDPPTPIPSVSALKGVWPKFLTSWAGRQAAEYAVKNHSAWVQLGEEEAIDLIAKASDRAKNRAARRGTDVHTFAETLAEGQRPDWTMAGDDVLPFRAAIEKMVRDLRIQPVVSEAVIFNHAVKYGGTFDVIADTIHGRGLLDYKSRKAHSPYPEEACQVAAYAGGEYMIVEENGIAVRRPIPPMDYIAIITITPDGFKVHDVNEENAWNTWETVGAFFHAKAVGKFYDGVLNTPAAPQVEESNIRERIIALSPPAREYLAQQWPQDLPTLKQKPSQSDLMRIEDLVARVEDKAQATFNNPPLPDEGGMQDLKIMKHLIKVLDTLPKPIQECVDYWYTSASPSVRIGTHSNTVRRYEVLRMLIYAAAVAEGDITRAGELLPTQLGYVTLEVAEQTADELREQLETDVII